MQYINDVVRLNIRIRRTNKQLSSRQMADLLEMTAGGYSNLETGKNCFSVYHLWLLAKAWGIDPGEFFKPPIQP
jgi:transcriptional regulator with XRE-family HTH domain